MNYEELLEYLDLENSADFQYFEAMADLVECEDYIEPEAIYKLFADAEREVVSQIIGDYFEDILDGLPEDAGEIYSLLHQIKMGLMGMIVNAEDEDDMRKFADEVYSFRNWYSEESEVELTPETGDGRLYQNLRDAITTSRIEKLGGERYRYDFENALDYELDGYTMSFAEMIAAEEYEDQEDSIIFDPSEKIQ